MQSHAQEAGNPALTGAYHLASPIHQTLTGDWAGLRDRLDERGIEIGIEYIGEGFADVSGGIHRGTIYEGRLEVGLHLDLQKLVGWTGASFHASAFQIHGHEPSANLVGNLLAVSGSEAFATTRLYTLWLQQDLFGDKLSARFGQLAADDEFFVSDTAADLVNATCGWPGLSALDMTSGGPAYPLATPGVRVKVQPNENLAWLTGVFSGNPAGSHCTEEPQVCDSSGTTFSLAGGVLVMSEVQYSINQEKKAAGLPGTYKFGFWRESGSFADQHFGLNVAEDEVSLGSGEAVAPVLQHGDFGIYAVADQTLWRLSGEGERGLSGFARLGGAPADRNLVSFYADGGFGFKGPIPGRDDDNVVLGVAYAKISPDAVASDESARLLEPGLPVRSYETVIELTYLAKIIPGWVLQPDLQYVIHPAGGVPNPNGGAGPIRDALLLGLRTRLTF
ncbi:MAG TPA: carbohydrate porin [Stellaceae bacterium]|nr:carbohydrate porin [Stellaceae bacterium]